MTTIRASTHRWMQARGLYTVFGNPGSNELPFLRDLPPGIGTYWGCTREWSWAWPTATRRPRAGRRS